MNNHTYIRAYLAGVFIPTVIFPVLLTVLSLGKLTVQEPFPIERIVIFPLTFMPCLWGIWNMLWVVSHNRTHLPLGPHGAILPFLLFPVGASLARCLGVVALGSHSVTWFQAIEVPYGVIACGFAFALALYYLVWKYIVGFVNRALGIA